jgi:DNA polymerase
LSDTILQEISDFFTWYAATYGNEISVEGDLHWDQAALENTSGDETTIQKTELPDIPATTKPFNEILVHQGDEQLKTFYHEINQCTRCALHGNRTNFVFGMGNPHADVMFIGEAPGRDEDLQGLPFVGKAGHLLDKMLFALRMQRQDVYIANVLKCRPPNNRDPLPDEVMHCEPYLKKQIEIIKPRVIIALGRISAQVLLKKNDSLSLLRQNEQIYEGIPFIVTYHPAALLRNPGWKVKTWQDLRKIRHYLT